MIWITYCLLEGLFHGWFYHNYLQYKFKFDTHIIWNAMRVTLISAILWHNWEQVYFFESKQFFLILIYPAMQPFLHNGMYYTARYFMSGRKIYKKLWFDQSTTSTAHLTKFLTPGVRMFLFGCGLLMYIILL